MKQKIILFDGVCNFCDGAVQFIIKRDKKEQFYFASLQGEEGQRLVDEYEVDKQTDSIILLEKNHVYTKSTASLRILKEMSGLWKLLYILIAVPPFIRNKMYDLLARNRYKWFGKKSECTLPSPSVRKRFLD
ncbi:thiol-disulfide oxidoreductase DCC family protein [Pontibacillus salicampi]|uniref:Thiol-disulfide oxidoreductase DCC family protein n=1 Tax=Pontibacillus salicampi TaxID=1449801 RepID=A0ABV6LKC3_9BACI